MKYVLACSLKFRIHDMIRYYNSTQHRPLRALANYRLAFFHSEAVLYSRIMYYGRHLRPLRLQMTSKLFFFVYTALS